MYRHAAHRQVFWPVTIETPADGGTVDRQQFDLLYTLLDADSGAQYAALVEAGDIEGLRAFLLTRVTDWRDVLDETTSEPVPFTSDALAALLRDFFFLRAVLRGLQAAMSGAPAGN